VDTLALSQLLQPFVTLNEAQLCLTSIYIDLLVKWNARINLTAVRDPQEIVSRHFGESFFAAERLLALPGCPSHITDLGSGAGFPGLPIAMMATNSRVTLIESKQKKATFLREVIFALGLKNVEVFAGRGEDYPGHGDLLTMRAVEGFDISLRIALGLLEDCGTIGLMIGRSQMDQAVKMGSELTWQSPVSIPGGNSRVLFVGAKAIKVEQK
jgi:16S rRNA (guanine527-N7)-methyltransferase